MDKIDGSISVPTSVNNADIEDKKEIDSKTNPKKHVEPKDDMNFFKDLGVVFQFGCTVSFNVNKKL